MAARIEADATGGDDSFDAESITDSTASISSSIFEQHYFKGRAYANPKYGKHWAPNDETQLEALDIIHHWLTLMLDNKLYLPPIGQNPQMILDVGTGTGIWAINMADDFPSAKVIGTDLAPTQPSWVPPNLEFQIDDASQEWTFAPETFDFIHIRYLQGTIEDWERLYKEAFRALKPGGWIQHIEPDLQILSDNPDIKVDKDHIFTRWAETFLKVGQVTNRTFDFTNEKLATLAKGAGFTSVVHENHKIPVGRWPRDRKLKELGTFVSLSFSQALDGFVKLPLCDILGWDEAKMQVFAAEMRSVLMNNKTRGTGRVFSVYGQKPERVPETEPQPETEE
ncbi:S-adenosyl-L-methionine-dependent methyltransferase [Dactylonectria macrodidyma]|uniref:S-adenosyl-L-methionine-dependent methyltransferase n=1 Tax=Dactylonectria macrodidyma TaxID=307937 RepID=A0A9P9E4V3_9HYPO|nr:S-adenosyl-L-methionine-dependent methyltransferase [Dactylonectria macrodidyma]